MKNNAIEISWGSLWRILFFAIFVAVLYFGRNVLLGLFIAIIISSGLEVIVNLLEKYGIPRTLGVILIFLGVLLAIIVLLYVVIPRIVVELNAVFYGLGSSASDSLLGPILDLKSQSSFGSLVKKFSFEFFSGNLSPIGLFSRALGSFGLAVAVFVSSFYLSLSKDGVERFLKVILPPDYEKQGLKIYENSRRKIGLWFQTQILLSIIMGVLVWGSLAMLGVRHALLIGVFAGVFEIVPFVGPILSGAIAMIVAFSISTNLALYTLITFLVLHQFESHVLVPILMKKSTGLHPVVVIVALLIGAEVWGILGILVAVPVAAIFEEVLNEWSSKKHALARTV